MTASYLEGGSEQTYQSLPHVLHPVLPAALTWGGSGLETVIVSSDDFSGRSARLPDHAAENKALVALAQTLSASPATVLQKFAESALELCRGQSAGISLLDATGSHFHWPAVAGQWTSHKGGGTPRDFGPCGTVLDRNAALVFSHPERHFTYLAGLRPQLIEALLVPLYVADKTVGTLWVVMHEEGRHFDLEDLRLVNNLAAFASCAHRSVLALEHAVQAKASLSSHMTELSALYRFTDRLYRATSPSEVYDAALDAIGEALGCRRASLLVHDQKGIMRFVAWRGLSDTYRQAVEGHSPWTRDTRDPAPICIEDINKADLPNHLKAAVRAEGIGALAFIPLVDKGQLVGKFMTYYNAPHVFTNAERDLACNIARQLGFGVERMRAEEQHRQAQERQDLLSREIQHRTRNLFAVVQAVIARTFTGRTTIKEAEAALRERLHSLAQTHAIVADGAWRGADLSEVVRAEMTPFADRVMIEGPPVLIAPQAAQNFTLALHELATNAAKYGALSNEFGRVHITWSVLQSESSSQFIFRWQERGGPPVKPPLAKGFGTTVLERILSEYAATSPKIEYAVNGLSYELTGPLDRIATAATQQDDSFPSR